MTDWYFRKDGKKCGPVNTASLKKLARTGNLQPSDMIWRTGLSKWVPASKAKGLFDSDNIETNTNYDCPSSSRVARNNLSKSKATEITSEAKIIIALVSVVTLVIGMLLLWVFVLRDTWELHNSYQLEQMSQSIVDMIENGNLREGVNKYDEMLAFIGDRELENPELRRAMLDAKEVTEQARKKVNEAKNLERIKYLEERAKAFALSGEIKRAVEAYREALDLIQKADSGNPEFAIATRRISGPKQQLEEQLAEIVRDEARRKEDERKRREQEAYEKEMVSKGYVKYRGKWISPEEYTKAKSVFPAQEIREGIKGFSHYEYDYIVQSIQIKRSDDVEFPYAIEIAVSSSFRVLIDSEPDQATYTFQVDGDLNISDSYTIRGGERHSEIEGLVKCMQTVLSKIRSGW